MTQESLAASSAYFCDEVSSRPSHSENPELHTQSQAGDYVVVRVERTSPGTLFAVPIVRTKQGLWNNMLYSDMVGFNQSVAPVEGQVASVSV